MPLLAGQNQAPDADLQESVGFLLRADEFSYGVVHNGDPRFRITLDAPLSDHLVFSCFQAGSQPTVLVSNALKSLLAHIPGLEHVRSITFTNLNSGPGTEADARVIATEIVRGVNPALSELGIIIRDLDIGERTDGSFVLELMVGYQQT